MQTDNALPKKYDYEPIQVIKFLASSLIGVGAFMLPLPLFDGKTLVAAFSNFLLINLDGFLMGFIAIVVWISTIFGIINLFTKIATKYNHFIDQYFGTKKIYLATRVVSSLILVFVLFDINIPMITNEQTSGSMIDLAKSLVTISIALSYVLPFLTKCGIMEFFGVLTQNLITPLFKVPGVAALDLVTSWFGASNAEVILCREKYRMGYYSQRETAVVMCNFSLVSISFIYVVSSTARLEEYFTIIFLACFVISVLLAIIMARIPPLSVIADEYYQEPIDYNNSPPENVGRFKWALIQGSNRAKEFGFKEVFEDGTKVMVSIWIDLVPIVIAWGTIGLIMVYYTPIFEIISYPIGWLFELMLIEDAFAAAPASLIGFVDMFIPSLLISGIESVETRFIITVLSLVQMIYMTEVGAIILQSEIGINFKKLLVIFIQRTILSFPLIYLIAKLLF